MAAAGTPILIAGEEHDAGFSLNADKFLTLQAGWDAVFKKGAFSLDPPGEDAALTGVDISA